MNDFWRAFIFGFSIAVIIIAIFLSFLAVNWLPKLVERGVTAALSGYEVTYEETDN